MNAYRYQRISLMVLLSLLMIACTSRNNGTPTSIPSQVSSVPATHTITPTFSPSPEPTHTTTSGVVVILAVTEADNFLVGQVQPALDELAADAGLQLQMRSSLSLADLTPDIRLVVTLPPDPGLTQLAASAPNTQFLAIGIPNLEPTTNLSVIGPHGSRPDELGFLAGYIAAAVTPEWRVGMLAISATREGVANREGFLNGVVFFCGLCRQTYPPFHNYPMYVELAADDNPVEKQAAAAVLINQSVKTVYIAPGGGDEELLSYLAQNGVNIIGSEPPPPAIKEQWVASISPAFKPSLQEAWPQLMEGHGGLNLPMTSSISDVNAELFSPGRQHLVEKFLSELQAGYIDTGVGSPE